jgi:hypothetical protein
VVAEVATLKPSLALEPYARFSVLNKLKKSAFKLSLKRSPNLKIFDTRISTLKNLWLRSSIVVPLTINPERNEFTGA